MGDDQKAFGVPLASIGVQIPLSEVYAKVRFEGPPGPTAVPG